VRTSPGSEGTAWRRLGAPIRLAVERGDDYTAGDEFPVEDNPPTHRDDVPGFWAAGAHKAVSRAKLEIVRRPFSKEKAKRGL